MKKRNGAILEESKIIAVAERLWKVAVFGPDNTRRL